MRKWTYLCCGRVIFCVLCVWHWYSSFPISHSENSMLITKVASYLNWGECVIRNRWGNEKNYGVRKAETLYSSLFCPSLFYLLVFLSLLWLQVLDINNLSAPPCFIFCMLFCIGEVKGHLKSWLFFFFPFTQQYLVINRFSHPIVIPLIMPKISTDKHECNYS